MQTIAQLNYSTHRVQITKNPSSGIIYCFKYNDRRCDLRLFREGEDDQCADYIMTALPTWEWGFVEDTGPD
jgi:hypothetical protein